MSSSEIYSNTVVNSDSYEGKNDNLDSDGDKLCYMLTKYMRKRNILFLKLQKQKANLKIWCISFSSSF